MDATHQRWARENIILRERTNAVLGRCREIRADLNERKKKSKSLRRQFDSITEHIDIFIKFLEKLRSKTAGYKYVIYKGGPNNQIEAST
jgi:hypothetical protein